MRFRFDIAFCITCIPTDDGRHYPYVPLATSRDPLELIIERCIQRITLETKPNITCHRLRGLTFWTPSIEAWLTEHKRLHSICTDAVLESTLER